MSTMRLFSFYRELFIFCFIARYDNFLVSQWASSMCVLRRISVCLIFVEIKLHFSSAYLLIFICHSMGGLLSPLFILSLSLLLMKLLYLPLEKKRRSQFLLPYYTLAIKPTFSCSQHPTL